MIFPSFFSYFLFVFSFLFHLTCPPRQRHDARNALLASRAGKTSVRPFSCNKQFFCFRFRTGIARHVNRPRAPGIQRDVPASAACRDLHRSLIKNTHSIHFLLGSTATMSSTSSSTFYPNETRIDTNSTHIYARIHPRQYIHWPAFKYLYINKYRHWRLGECFMRLVEGAFGRILCHSASVFRAFEPRNSCPSNKRRPAASNKRRAQSFRHSPMNQESLLHICLYIYI